MLSPQEIRDKIAEMAVINEITVAQRFADTEQLFAHFIKLPSDIDVFREEFLQFCSLVIVFVNQVFSLPNMRNPVNTVAELYAVRSYPLQLEASESLNSYAKTTIEYIDPLYLYSTIKHIGDNIQQDPKKFNFLDPRYFLIDFECFAQRCFTLAKELYYKEKVPSIERLTFIFTDILNENQNKILATYKLATANHMLEALQVLQYILQRSYVLLGHELVQRTQGKISACNLNVLMNSFFMMDRDNLSIGLRLLKTTQMRYLSGLDRKPGSLKKWYTTYMETKENLVEKIIQVKWSRVQAILSTDTDYYDSLITTYSAKLEFFNSILDYAQQNYAQVLEKELSSDSEQKPNRSISSKLRI